jgi:hypothetical protein
MPRSEVLRAVSLVERLKDLFLFVLGNTQTGIDDFKKPGLGALLLHPERDLAAVRELYGVAQQVNQHLPQLAFIAPHPRLWWNLQKEPERDPLLCAERLKDGRETSSQ